MSDTRDFIMARLAATRGALAAAEESLDQCILFFLAPDADKKGEDRYEALEAVLDASGDMSRSIELAQAAMETMGPEELLEEEPDGEELGKDGAKDST